MTKLRTPSRDQGRSSRRSRVTDRTSSAAALRDDVRGQGRRAVARVRRDDKHGVLAQDVPKVGRKATRLRDDRRATAPVVLRAKDVDGETGLALTRKDARRGRDRVAGEVRARRGGDGGRRLRRIDGAAQRALGQGLALAEADQDADGTGRDGASEAAESHVLSLVDQRRRLKKWAAEDYILIWFGRGDTVRLTTEHVDPIRGSWLRNAGWKRMVPGRYTRTCTLDELPNILLRLGWVMTNF